ncbi:MAG TPA: EsaB/YukD family protein [Pseudogracilibacillus sp.]|nr:EsaB/YukD family protein [Pseudogracilibacillus sp.]
MYIHVTVDLSNYNQPPIELRLSNQHSIKSLIDVVWQSAKITTPPREGFWVRVQNKNKTIAGSVSLVDSGVTTGDRIEIL